jgi:glycosyltransferase involved in cell wall biosynthesis/ubiquinone/menaquinone biosynthesis C-methylase UbiE
MVQENQGSASSVGDQELQISGFNNTGLVSIIIPSRNSERTIAECLRSIIGQSYRPIEIIMVDSNSTDSTREIAKGMGALVISNDGERSVAKNLGAKFASGKYLFFVDADHELGHSAIASCVKAIERVDGVLINDQDVSKDSKVSRLVASRRNILSRDPLNVAVRFVRKDVFHRVGGFDTDLYAGEDLDFHRRFLQLGFRMVDSRATDWHLGSPVNLKALLNRSLYYSSNNVRYASKNPLIALRRISPLRVVAAWKRSDASASDLLPVVLLGLLSNTFLVIGVLLSLGRRQDTPNVDPKQINPIGNRTTPSKRNVIDNYNKEGRNYDNIRYGRTKGGRFFSQIELRKSLEMVKGEKVLHVGTATGRVSVYLVSSGFDYVGLELSGAMVRITKEKLNGAGDIVQADAEHLPFKPSAFDDVVSVRSFHFLPHPEAFLNEANRVLKQTGRVTVSFERNVRGRETFRKLMSLPPSNARRTYYSNPEVTLMMRNAGFEPLFARNVTKLPLLFYWRSNHDRVLKRLHGKIPSFMGTVGMVVGSKETQSLGVG